jgi:mono/diheme cytochrome c family protein
MSSRRPKRTFFPAPLFACVCLYAPHATAKEAPNIPPATHRWTLADFGGVLSVGLEGHRNYEAGLRLYRAHCGNCHTLGKHGDGSASDLTRRALTYSPEELLNHLLDPAKHRPSKATQGGLLDPLPQAAVLDILAFVLSGADPKSPFFFQP